MEASPNPNGWESGPPESKSESWNYERRTELINIASALLQAQVVGVMRQPEAWEGSPLDAIDPKKSVGMAMAMITEAERVQPKR